MSHDDENGDTFKVESYQQSGGITAGKLNVKIQPGWRKLNEQDRQSLAKLIADERGKPFKLVTELGNVEAMTYAIEIRETLKDNGIEVEESVIAGPAAPLAALTCVRRIVGEREWVEIWIGDQNSPH